MLVLKSIWGLSALTVTLIGAAALFGAIFGGFSGGILAVKFAGKEFSFSILLGIFLHLH